MSNILDEGNYGNSSAGFQHDKIQLDQLNTIGSRSRLVAIFSLIAQSFGVLAGIGLLMIPSGVLREITRERQVREALESAGWGEVDLGAIIMWVGLALIAFAAVGIYVNTKAIQFGNSLQSYARTHASSALEDATAARKTYFMLTAILAGLGLLFNLVFMFAI